jgi:hypothetical protein
MFWTQFFFFVVRFSGEFRDLLHDKKEKVISMALHIIPQSDYQSAFAKKIDFSFFFKDFYQNRLQKIIKMILWWTIKRTIFDLGGGLNLNLE